MQAKFMYPDGIILTRQEVRYLMALLEAERAIGLEQESDDPLMATPEVRQQTLAQGRSLLRERGLVGEGLENRDADFVDDFSKVMTATFFPLWSVIIVRDLPQLGKQVLIFCQNRSLLVLHTFPKENYHRLSVFENKQQAAALILDWFPLHNYPASEDRFLIKTADFDAIREQCELGNADKAMTLLTAYELSDTDKQALVEAISQRTISGSFAQMLCNPEQQEIIDARTFAVFAGPATAWFISRPADAVQDDSILVKRIGPEFVNFVAGLFV
ncbi:MAG: hypothetical protein JXA33_12865 [Anaerolineae bacterium]|nr:hypothetical protein [Anaerolineae bacterium]